MSAKKYVYFFGRGRGEGSARMKNLLGGKGSNLAEMTNLKISVPPGFTITTEACVESMKRRGSFPPGMWKQVEKNLGKLEKAMGLKFGDRNAPLLVSVRSGARVSMPGMMDTVLNLGLNDQAVEGLAGRSRNPRFAYDSYRRFIQMFSNVVLGIPIKHFEELLEKRKRERGVELDTELTAADLQEIVRRYKALVRERIGREFPQDPRQQLRLAVVECNHEQLGLIRNELVSGLGVAVQPVLLSDLASRRGRAVAGTAGIVTTDCHFAEVRELLRTGNHPVYRVALDASFPHRLLEAGRRGPVVMIVRDRRFAGVLEETSAVYVGLGWRQRRLWEPSMDVPQGRMPIGLWRRPQVASAFRTYCGWPLCCLYGEQWTRYVDGGERSETIYRYASALPVERGMVARESARILPLRPIWLGFVIDTAFFGGILWLATRGPFVLRHVIRRRRGRCPGCGYPVGTSAVCTECAEALAPHVTITG
ncbi:MAG: hypothetical protein IH782_02905 [candidate division NC10 bacterium]|nr:hypothetical protein [candidate division NC10 bacterium]